MASIKINNLSAAGSDLFTDSESYMHELSDAELSQQGGMSPATSVIFFTILALRACA